MQSFSSFSLSRLCPLLSAAGLLTGSIVTLHAQTADTWNGGTGNWSDSTLWSAGVPNGAGASVFVDGGNSVNSTVTVDGSYTVGALNISSGDAVSVASGQTFTITDSGGFAGAGTFTNNGAFLLGNASSGATLFLTGNTTLAGTGTFTLANNTVVLSSGGTGTVTIGSGQTIQGATGTGSGVGFGSGQLGIVNNGTINASVSGQTLLLSPNSSGLTNNGLLEASNGGTLNLDGSSGTFTNNGEFRVNDGSRVNDQYINTDGTLTGGRYTVLSTSSAQTVLNFGDGAIFTNAAKVVLSGVNSSANALGDLATNQGTFAIANGHAFTTFGALSNSGTLVAAGGSTLTVNGDLTQSNTGTLTGNGGFTASTLSISGKIAPGGSISATTGAFTGGAGTLTLTGTTVLNSDADLTFELGAAGTATSDHLNVAGALTLDGRVDVTALTGFAAGRYDLIDYTGTLTNDTLEIGTLPAGYSATVDTSIIGQVDLLIVPEPGTFWLAGIGGAVLLILRRRPPGRRRLWPRAPSA